MNDTRDRAMLGMAPLIFVGIALFASWAAHGIDDKGAPAILAFVIVTIVYGLAKALLDRYVKPILLLVLAVIALHAIGQVLIVLITTGQLTRPIDTNVLAPVMLAAFLMVVKEKRKLAAGLYFAALLIAGSRAGYLAVGAVYIVSPWGKREKFWWVPVCGVLAGFIGLTVLRSTHGLDLERLTAWQIGLGMWSDSWWVGAGPGGFYQLGLYHLPHSHNVWTQAAADLGWGGIIAVIGVVGFYIRAIEKSEQPRWGWALLAALLVAGMFDFIYWVPQASILLLLIADEVIGASVVSEYGGVFASSPDNRWSSEVHLPPV